MAHLGKSKPCEQEGLCSQWEDCPYARDSIACFNAAMMDMEPEQ